MAPAGDAPVILIVAAPRGIDLLRELLAGFRCTALGADSSDAAIAMCHQHRPHAVLISYHVEQLQPHRVVHALRADPCSSHAYVMLVRLFPFHQLDIGDVKAAYESIGVEAVHDFHASAQALGRDAAAQALLEKLATGLRRARQC